jgi:hypothetical protein
MTRELFVKQMFWFAARYCYQFPTVVVKSHGFLAGDTYMEQCMFSPVNDNIRLGSLK